MSHSAFETAASYAAAYCPPPGRAARSVSLQDPHFPLAKGDTLTVQYEFQVHNTTLSSIHITVYAPSMFGQFTQLNGSVLQFYLGPRTFTLSSTAWTNPANATLTKTMGGATVFDTTRPAFMTSELIAIMATAAQGTLNLSFRWHWSVTFASNGTTVTSAWSSLHASSPSSSIFEPAPYVQLVSKTNTTVAIGGYFTAYLLGAISKTKFGSELEYGSNGNVIRANGTLTPKGNTTAVAVSIQMLPDSNAALGPSKMLDHIHNACGALLYSISLVSVYSAHATVSFSISPSSCGSLSFNGSAYANGGSTTVVPSSAGLTISAGTCAGHTFSNWTRSGGVSVASLKSSGTTAVVSATGTLTEVYI